jgi:hypothetical protein
LILLVVNMLIENLQTMKLGSKGCDKSPNYSATTALAPLRKTKNTAPNAWTT